MKLINDLLLSLLLTVMIIINFDIVSCDEFAIRNARQLSNRNVDERIEALEARLNQLNATIDRWLSSINKNIDAICKSSSYHIRG